MITEFSLENFRVFRDKATFKIKPITILTGPNNSGKSSVNKALLLMKNSFSKSVVDYLGNVPKELIHEMDNIEIGAFLQYRSQNSNNDKVLFSFGVFVPKLAKSFDIELHYKNVEQTFSTIRNGRLSGYCIKYRNEKLFEMMEHTESISSSLIEQIIGFQKFKIDLDEVHVLLVEYIYNLFQENTDMHLIKRNRNELNDTINKQIYNIFGNHKDYKTIKKREISQSLMKFDAVLDIKKKLENGKSIEIIQNDLTNNFNLMNGVINREEIIIEILDEIKQQIALGNNTLFDIPQLRHHLKQIAFPNNGIGYRLEDLHNELEKIDNTELSDQFYLLSALSLVFPNHYNYFNFLLYFATTIQFTINNELKIALQNANVIPNYKGDVKRSYTHSDQNYIAATLRKYFEYNSFYELTEMITSEADSDPFSRLNSFSAPLKYLNLYLQKNFNGNKFIVEFNPECNALIPYLVSEKSKINMADCGAGLRQIISILLTIIPDSNKFLKTDSINHIIEEPETNLHPALQSQLAEIFVDINKRTKNNFLIETHSEYFIRKLQYLVAKGECDPDDVVIYYIDNPDPEQRAPGAPQVREITLDRNGRMSHDFGPGFFDEADNLAIQLFNINQNSN